MHLIIGASPLLIEDVCLAYLHFKTAWGPARRLDSLGEAPVGDRT
jgi:hypothetical protein